MSLLSQAKKIFKTKEAEDKTVKAKAVKKTEVKAKETKVKKTAPQKMVMAGDIGLSVVLSEKSIAQQASQTVVVKVVPSASKQQIAGAVEDLFAVKVLSVRTMKNHPKIRRRGMTAGLTNNWKKAYVTVDDISKLNVAP